MKKRPSTWRRYGQSERVVDGEIVKTLYFGCKHPGCPVKKKVETKGSLTTENCKYEHNHEVEESTPLRSPSQCVVWVRAGSEDFVEVADEDDGYSWVKYGQKSLKHGVMKSYYRCEAGCVCPVHPIMISIVHPTTLRTMILRSDLACEVDGCEMKKQVEGLHIDGAERTVRMLVIGHNHPKPTACKGGLDGDRSPHMGKVCVPSEMCLDVCLD